MMHQSHKDEINDIIHSVATTSAARLKKNIGDIQSLAAQSEEIIESSSIIQSEIERLVKMSEGEQAS